MKAPGKIITHPVLLIFLLSLVLATASQALAPEPPLSPQALADRQQIQKNNNETVLLLHGALVGSGSMKLLAGRLRAQGFTVINLPYPDRRMTVFECAEYLAPAWEKLADQAPGRVHIVGHSLGGLVARRLLSLHQPENFGRLLTLGTPHLGSPLADNLRNYDIFQKAFGPVGQELITQRPIDWPAPWPPPYEIGLIAGNIPIGPGALTLKGASDGTVLAVSAQPRGGTAYATVTASHTTLPYARETAEKAGKFLRLGRF